MLSEQYQPDKRETLTQRWPNIKSALAEGLVLFETTLVYSWPKFLRWLQKNPNVLQCGRGRLGMRSVLGVSLGLLDRDIS